MENINSMDELEDFIWKNKDDKVIVVYFGATWCGPCDKLKKRLISEEVRKHMPDLVIAHIELDENSDLADLYNVQSIPTQIFIKLNDKKIVEFCRIIGYDWIKFSMTYEDYKKN